MVKDLAKRRTIASPMARVILLAIVVGAGILTPKGITGNAPTSSTGDASSGALASGANSADLAALYAKAAGHVKVPLKTRMAAARRLVRSEQAEPWTALLILSSQLRPTGTQMEQRRKKGRLRNFELAVTVAAIYALPARTKSSTLFALTELLVETNKGVWSEKKGILVKRISEHRSPPIRELARDHLKARLGVDHGWDADAWRKAILEMTVAEQAGKTPGTLPSTTVLSPQSQPSS